MLRKGRIEARIARRRRVVERPLAWPNRYRHRTVRDHRRAGVGSAFLLRGCALICWNRLAGERS